MPQIQETSILRSIRKYLQLFFSLSKRGSSRQRPGSSSPSHNHVITINGDVHITHCNGIHHTHTVVNETPTYLYQPTHVVNSNSNSFNHTNSSSVGVTNDYSTNTFLSSSTPDINESTSDLTSSTRG